MIGTDSERNFYTVDEVALMFDVTPYTIRGWIRKGDLKAPKVGRIYTIYPADLRQFAIEKFDIETLPLDGIDG